MTQLPLQTVFIALSGKAYSGKTTLAHELYKALAQGQRYNFLTRSIAEPIKRKLRSATGIEETPENKDRYREGYQWYGNFMRSEHGEDYFARILISNAHYNATDNIIVDDMRLPAEMRYFRSITEKRALYFTIRLNITPEEQARRYEARFGIGIPVALTLDTTETALDSHMADFDLIMDAQMPTDKQVNTTLDMLCERGVKIVPIASLLSTVCA